MEFNKEEAFIDSLAIQPAGASSFLEKDIPTSKDISGIEVRLSKVLIKDNGTPAVWPFPGLARMYLMTIVISDAANGVVSLDLKGFPKVGDDEELPVDRTLFLWKKDKEEDRSPGQIHVFASVIKSKEDLRNTGTILSEVKGDSGYKDLVSNITSLVSQASPVGMIADAAFSVASIVGKYLSAVKDKPWFTWVQSFTDINGDMDKLGVTTLGRESNRVAMSLSIIVRDKDRESLALEGLDEDQKAEMALD